LPNIDIRSATLEDCAHISGLAQAQVRIWQRWDAQGRVEDVPYAALTLYERWLYGGAWMSVETAAIHLGRLLLGAGIPLVAAEDGEVVGYCEAYLGAEPEPYGAHLYVAYWFAHPDRRDASIENSFIQALRETAKAYKCARIITTPTAGEHALRAFQANGTKLLTRLHRYAVPARTGQGLYKANEDAGGDAAQINGWQMPSGHMTSARESWERLWQRTWDVLPDLEERTHRLRISASGHEACVAFVRGQYNPRTLEVSCWSPRPLSQGLLIALRDWAHREGYRTLSMVVSEDTIKTLGADAEADGFMQDVFMLGG
jgi:hypothetical protein